MGKAFMEHCIRGPEGVYTRGLSKWQYYVLVVPIKFQFWQKSRPKSR